jgi:serine/threonine protein kinase
MDTPSHAHRDSIGRFVKWQQDALLRGINGVPHDEDTAALAQEDSYFIPQSALKDYFTDEQIRDLLNDVHDDDTYSAEPSTIRAIKSKFVVVFAILLNMDMGQHICKFVAHSDEMSDLKLPFTDQRRPDQFPGNPQMYMKFCQHQWRFCTEELDNNMAPGAKFHENKILPVRSEEWVGSGVSAVIFKIELHESFDNLRTRDEVTAANNSACNNVYVVKRFTAEAHWRREVKAFRNFARDVRPEPNLIGFYGAYIHGSTFNIILQYAESGNLNDFFFNQDTRIPSTPDQRLAFWTQLFGIITAVHRLHQWPGEEGEGAQSIAGSMSYQGCHHDIKPSNILVTADPRDSSRQFPFKFLLADLGLASLAKFHRHENEDAVFDDPKGTRAYGPPETSRPSGGSGRHLIAKRKVDTWSLGCIFSEALAWSMGGPAELKTYRDRRLKERNDFFEDGECFHNGVDVLETVKQQHEHCIAGGANSTLVNDIVKNILNFTLEVEKGRFDATQLAHQAAKVLDAEEKLREARLRPYAEHGLTAGQTMEPPTPTFPPPDLSRTLDKAKIEALRVDIRNIQSRSAGGHTPKSSIQGPSSEDSSAVPEGHPSRRQASARASPLPKRSGVRPPRITIEELKQWHAAQKSKTTFTLNPLSNLQQLRGRDLVFVIDDSISMSQHWEKVITHLKYLGYAIKEYDDDGMELIFMSEAKEEKPYKAKDVTPLVQIAHSHKSRCLNPTHAEHCIARILEGYTSRFKAASSRSPPSTPTDRILFHVLPAIKRVKPLSLFVFTDAVWHPEGTCRVSKPILRLLNDLKDAPEGQVCISFIQFGQDPVGTKRLKYLDEGLAHDHGVRDIVDYEPVEVSNAAKGGDAAEGGNVLKMLLGSIWEWFDKENNSIENDRLEDLWCRD